MMYRTDVCGGVNPPVAADAVPLPCSSGAPSSSATKLDLVHMILLYAVCMIHGYACRPPWEEAKVNQKHPQKVRANVVKVRNIFS